MTPTPTDAPEAPPAKRAFPLDLSDAGDRTFGQVLLNTLVVSIVDYTVWFALTFWVFLTTRSVLATGVVAGVFVVATAGTGFWFGSLVDHHRKKLVMQAGCVASTLPFALAALMYWLVPTAQFATVSSVWLWVFVVVCMIGVAAGNLRTIAVPTMVTLLIHPDRRDRVNGLVGTITGVGFLVTSMISGLLVAAGGMRYVLILAVLAQLGAIAHLATLTIDEPAPGTLPMHAGTVEVNPAGEVIATEPTVTEPTATGTAATTTDATGAEPGSDTGKGIDIRGTLRVVGAIPGLPALILFTCINNFLGGAFMAIMDAYGLSMMSVRAWGSLWAVASAGLLVGGAIVARTGLGSNPVRLLLLFNGLLWAVCVLFPIRASVIALAVGCAVFMLMTPVVEAAEQTVLQKVVPYHRQGRVFGFAQSVEQAASPVTAFLVGPLTQLVFIPFMTDGTGAASIGSWFGTGPSRGMALVFILTGAIGIVLTVAALASPQYRRLRTAYHAAAPAAPAAPATA